MALRNQPYFPLYVQDYLTDEKLNLCSWQTQGIYIKILCILHKQKEYGCILFKQNDKQNSSTCLNFALILIKNLPCQLEEMKLALEELVENEVLTIEDNKLYQKRMVKDGQVSEERSKAGKKGGGNPNLFKQNSKQEFKQIDKQNTEYEYEYEYKDINKDSIKEEEKIENLNLHNYILGGIEDWDNLTDEQKNKYSNLMYEELINSHSWITDFVRLKKISETKIKNELKDFCVNQKLSGDIKRGMKELKKHFTNIINKKIKELV